MALPNIQPYPMPGARDVPGNRVDWTVDPNRAALLIHDMQNYFVDAFDASSEPIPELLANITALRDRCRFLGIPVIYSAQPASQTLEQRGLLQDFWGDGIGAGPGQADVIDELAPADGDVLLTKWRYSAFVKTDLHGELRARGRDQLMICGIYAHIGCLMTATQAFMEEVQPFFVVDAVADFSREEHDMATRYAARRCAVTLTTGAALSQLEAASEEPFWTGPSRVSVRARLAELTEESLDDFGDDDDLADAGIDSIKLMGVISEWQQAGYAVSFEELAEEPTIAAWASLLSRTAAAVS